MTSDATTTCEKVNVIYNDMYVLYLRFTQTFTVCVEWLVFFRCFVFFQGLQQSNFALKGINDNINAMQAQKNHLTSRPQQIIDF